MYPPPQFGVAPGPPVVMVPASEFSAGMLPPVCMTTGQPATEAVHRRFTTSPWWVILVILLSLLIGIIVYFAVRKSAAGPVPLSRPIAEKVRRLRVIAMALLIACPVLVVFAIVLASPGSGTENLVGMLLLLALLALVAGLFVKIAETRALRVKVTLFNDPYGALWLKLEGVHPFFAQALAALAQQRMAGWAMPGYGMQPPPGYGIPSQPYPAPPPPPAP